MGGPLAQRGWDSSYVRAGAWDAPGQRLPIGLSRAAAGGRNALVLDGLRDLAFPVEIDACNQRHGHGEEQP